MLAEHAIATLRAWFANDTAHLTAEELANALSVVEQPVRPRQGDLLQAEASGVGINGHERLHRSSAGPSR